MFTQVELVYQNKTIVYWLHHTHNSRPICAGRGVKILEEADYFKINRVFVTLGKMGDLPANARLGTIVELN